ncbi:uncharacterized protein N7459_004722 [Penicillium hispanicum]|uniref:uncharacterized protein n=1 Tax=Penicillium hispanicum TaxID=1080232 RepID=UPI0025413D8D|nr:uncharacterized protein N7459_004722 [Penicillium hispanicum]KAJ5584922.1 hypothetical protein N7459_004722 [Penicillium hispanicum]
MQLKNLLPILGLSAVASALPGKIDNSLSVVNNQARGHVAPFVSPATEGGTPTLKKKDTPSSQAERGLIEFFDPVIRGAAMGGSGSGKRDFSWSEVEKEMAHLGDELLKFFAPVIQAALNKATSTPLSFPTSASLSWKQIENALLTFFAPYIQAALNRATGTPSASAGVSKRDFSWSQLENAILRFFAPFIQSLLNKATATPYATPTSTSFSWSQVEKEILRFFAPYLQSALNKATATASVSALPSGTSLSQLEKELKKFFAPLIQMITGGNAFSSVTATPSPRLGKRDDTVSTDIGDKPLLNAYSPFIAEEWSAEHASSSATATTSV